MALKCGIVGLPNEPGITIIQPFVFLFSGKRSAVLLKKFIALTRKSQTTE